MSELSPGDKQVLNDVERYGFHIVHILGDEDGPPFSFTIGLTKTYGHPELLIIGLKQELTHFVLNDLAQEIKGGKVYAANSWSADVLEGHECYFTGVDKKYYRDYLGYANWFYKGNDFEVLQCVYPTTKGIYPWQAAWPDMLKDLQPVLGEINI